MWFTEAEAKAQQGKWVRVRDGSLWLERIDKGAHGKVVHAQPYQGDDWSICIEVYLSQDHSLSVLLHNVDKKHYAGTFEEIPAERSSRATRMPHCAHFLRRNAHPARRAALTLVSSGGPIER
jgi:hypothetical protein